MLFGSTHGYAVRVGHRFVQLICRSDMWNLSDEHAESAYGPGRRRAPCPVPEARNPARNWTWLLQLSQCLFMNVGSLGQKEGNTAEASHLAALLEFQDL